MGFLAAATFAGAALAPLTGALGFDGRATSSAARRRAASALRSRAASSLAACAESARELAVRSPRGGASEPCPPCRSARDQSWSAAASKWSSQRRKVAPCPWRPSTTRRPRPRRALPPPCSSPRPPCQPCELVQPPWGFLLVRVVAWSCDEESRSKRGAGGDHQRLKRAAEVARRPFS